MSGAGGDVAALLRLKVSREKAAAKVLTAQSAAVQSRQDAATRVQEAARARWPLYLNIVRDCSAEYREKSAELGVTTAVEELHRLRAWLPDLSVSFSRNDHTLATRVLLRMAADGKAYCTVKQSLGPPRPNLNRAECRIGLTESNVKQLFKSIVHILILEK